MFSNLVNKNLAKLDVLESKLNIYESLSKDMLEKLEHAVDKISESNQRIANILAKHDERIDQSIKTDELLVKMIDEVKNKNTEEHKAVLTRLEKVETTITELSKFRWQAAAVVGGAVLLMGFLTPFVDNLLQMPYNRGTEQQLRK